MWLKFHKLNLLMKTVRRCWKLQKMHLPSNNKYHFYQHYNIYFFLVFRNCVRHYSVRCWWYFCPQHNSKEFLLFCPPVRQHTVTCTPYIVIYSSFKAPQTTQKSLKTDKSDLTTRSIYSGSCYRALSCIIIVCPVIIMKVWVPTFLKSAEIGTSTILWQLLMKIVWCHRKLQNSH